MGRDLDHVVPTLLPQTGSSPTRSACSKPGPGMGQGEDAQVRILSLNVGLENFISLEGIPEQVCLPKNHIHVLPTAGKLAGSNFSEGFVLTKIHHNHNYSD